MGLYPTKTRLALLAAITNDQVSIDITVDDDDVILLFPNAPTEWETRERVTARVRELQQAGWTAEDPAGFWRLTPAGRTVLTAVPAKVITPIGGVL